MVYLNIKYVIATRSYEFFYLYAKSHWKYHTFEGYYICSFSKLSHKVHQKVRKCSLTFPPGHMLSKIYNCTKAGNRRAKRGGPRKSERGVRVEPSEADAFIDFRTRFCYSGITNDFKILLSNRHFTQRQ